MHKNNPLTIGLFGAGRIGKLHAENLLRLPEVELAGVYEVNREQVAGWAKERGIRLVRAPEELLAAKEVEAVLIASATNTHAALIKQAAVAGKHILCEKPIAHEVGEVNAALRAVEQAGVKLQLGFNRRFDRHFYALKERLVEGAIGKPFFIKIVSRDPAPPPEEYIAASGGLFLDMTIHDFDLVRFFSGSEVKEVSVIAEVYHDEAFRRQGDVDTASVNLRLENGMLANIINSRKNVSGYDQRIEVYGSEGTLSAGNVRENEVRLANAAGEQRAKPVYFFTERYWGAFQEEVRCFARSVRENLPVRAGARDGLEPLLIGLTARKAVAENRTVAVAEVRREALN